MVRRNIKLGSLLVAIMLAFVALFAFPVLSQDTDVDTTTENELMAVSAEWDATFNSADVDQMMELYAEDVVSMPPTLPRRVGKDALRADFEWIFETYNVTHETNVVDLQISNGLAIELGEYTMTFDPVDGSEDFIETGKHVMVRERIDDEWKVVWEIWNTTEDA